MSKKSKEEEGLRPVYLITGSDQPKVQRAVNRLRERVAADAGTDINIDVFDALDHDAAAVIQAASTLPFGEGPRLVLVMNAGAWRKADKDLMAGFLADPSPWCCLALVGSGIRRNEAVYRAVEARGQVLAYEAPRPADFPAWTREQAARRSLRLEIREARRLVALTGPNQQAIISELDKLAACLDGGAVTAEDIESLCWVSAEARVWDLTDALGAKSRPRVFRQLEAMLAAGTAPASIFFSLARHLKSLAAVVSARERGEDPQKAAAAAGLKPFPARKVAEQSRNFTAVGLGRALGVFSELDADIKGRSGLRPDLALERALSRLLDAV